MLCSQYVFKGIFESGMRAKQFIIRLYSKTCKCKTGKTSGVLKQRVQALRSTYPVPRLAVAFGEYCDYKSVSRTILFIQATKFESTCCCNLPFAVTHCMFTAFPLRRGIVARRILVYPSLATPIANCNSIIEAGALE